MGKKGNVWVGRGAGKTGGRGEAKIEVSTLHPLEVDPRTMVLGPTFGEIYFQRDVVLTWGPTAGAPWGPTGPHGAPQAPHGAPRASHGAPRGVGWSSRDLLLTGIYF